MIAFVIIALALVVVAINHRFTVLKQIANYRRHPKLFEDLAEVALKRPGKPTGFNCEEGAGALALRINNAGHHDVLTQQMDYRDLRYLAVRVNGRLVYSAINDGDVSKAREFVYRPGSWEQVLMAMK